MSEVDKRCIYASSEHLKMINYLSAMASGTQKEIKTLSVCEKNGAPRANQDLSVCFGEKESGGTSCFNDDAVIGLRNLVTERAKTLLLSNNHF
mgnify:CR=1 FL=1